MLFLFFNDTETTDIYTLSLHDALPICTRLTGDIKLNEIGNHTFRIFSDDGVKLFIDEDRKSTRLNSSHLGISYAVFCLKKKVQSPEDTPAGMQAPPLRKRRTRYAGRGE